MTFDHKAHARRIIASQIEDTEFMSCLEMTQDAAEEAGLTDDEHDDAGRKIHDLIGDAEVTVSWDDDEQAEVERLKARVAELEEDARLLAALNAAGVDNWDGYSYAHELLREWQAEDEAGAA